jgi:hypothetical protein
LKNLTADESTSQVLSELNYRKIAFLKAPGTKPGPLIGFLLFAKAKAPKKPNQTHPQFPNLSMTLNLMVWL